MTNIKTSELIGTQLDWAVAKCEGEPTSISGIFQYGKLTGEHIILHREQSDCFGRLQYSPSTEWTQGGPIIERECIATERRLTTGTDGVLVNAMGWRASCQFDIDAFSYKISEAGASPLIAAMRAYIASKLGDEVDIPDELT